jgi:flagellar hook-basal body complex protein FliE
MTAPIGYPEKFGALLDARLQRNEQAPGVTRGEAPKKTELGQAVGETKPALGPDFSEQLAEFVGGIDKTQKTARTQSEEFAVGHSNDIHGTMIAVEQAEISLRMLANVRNRMVDLYREVMRMGS